jgi:cytoskeletal protein RodZ
MDRDKRKKILLVVAVVILLLALLLWVLRTSDKNPNTNENSNTTPPVFVPPSANLEYNPSLEPQESSTEFSAINLAKSYIARFGSWSTDNQGANLKELLPLSSPKMQEYLASIELNFGKQEFSGNTTKSLSAKIININDNQAEILVNTQKINTKANLEQEVYYQEVLVKLIKSGEGWLVDQVEWK